ncbi:TIGR02300 family protein [Ancylobacter sp. 6x-1]|uniref:TIGR02300 family protein n=1 Tax=Ancylobacter crimeensis TaxID=2579147 RepID=A0ABT0DD49_9HYPH|nr:TIGR02300 family protein [Ancylobacter crimeensis]
MAKPELGTKRICPVTGRKFYDLNKDPVISPYTGQIVPISLPVTRSARPETARVVPETTDTEAEETGDIELVSLEDADEEANASPAKAASTEDDIEIEDEVDSDDDDTFLEEDEDSDDDVTDLIGDGIEDDEEG